MQIIIFFFSIFYFKEVNILYLIFIDYIYDLITFKMKFKKIIIL